MSAPIFRFPVPVQPSSQARMDQPVKHARGVPFQEDVTASRRLFRVFQKVGMAAAILMSKLRSDKVTVHPIPLNNHLY